MNYGFFMWYTIFMRKRLFVFFCSLLVFFSTACVHAQQGDIDVSVIPAYSGTPYVEINNNVPSFTDDEKSTTVYQSYSKWDDLGRCHQAQAILGKETMPTKKRGSIGMIKPSGWHTVRYDDLIEDHYLYNRCHLIAYMLSGQNANKYNLITGTRYMNVDGMLPFENQVADYIRSTHHHVLYRVTPIYDGNDLVAHGVHMEALSMEDQNLSFNVFVYNVQPGITIDYATGDSHRTENTSTETNTQTETETTSTETQTETTSTTYILNPNTHVFHRPECFSVKRMSENNKITSTDSRETIISEGYRPCKNCNP